MSRPVNQPRISTLWKQIVRWRGRLAVFSLTLFLTQIGFWGFKATITPFDRDAWLNRENRAALVTDLEWNRLKRGDPMHQVRETLGEPDSGYWTGAPHEDVYFLGQGGQMDNNGIFYIVYNGQGRLESAHRERPGSSPE